MAVGAACSGAFETCEQRTNGAFGPNGHARMTITAIGNSTTLIGGPASATLVSLFSMPPIFEIVTDPSMDLPGPGATALPGTLETCAVANPCP